jgi:hypothetical protein
VPGDSSCPSGNKSKCKHQQIQIVGYGATLDCNTSTDGVQGNCTASCGGTTTLRAAVSGGTPGYTYTLTAVSGTLYDDQGAQQSSLVFPTSGKTNNTSHDFTVTVNGDTTYKITVLDNSGGGGCERTAQATVTSSAPTATLAVSGNTSCNDGAVTFTAKDGDGNALPGTSTYKWYVDNVEQAGVTGVSFTLKPKLTNTSVLDTACRTVKVVVTSGGCDAPAVEKKVSQCITSTVADGACSA